MLAYAVLRRLRTEAPELFDGALALAAIEECFRQDGYPEF